jgi:hypothetical protein
MTQYGVVLFHTTSGVMRAEQILMKEGYSIKLIPTPRQFSSDCGIALWFEWSCCERIKVSLGEAKIEFNAIHFLDTKGI